MDNKTYMALSQARIERAKGVLDCGVLKISGLGGV